MKISNQLMFERGAQQMSNAQNKLAQLQAQLSLGKQVVNPSDAPDKAASILRLNSVLARQASYQASLNNVKTRLDAEETALTSATDLLIRLKEVTVQAANDTLGPDGRQALATEMQALREQLLSLANSQDSSGNYLFAGSRVREPAFARDASGYPAYQGDQTRMQVSIGDQRSLAINRTGTDAFAVAECAGGGASRRAEWQRARECVGKRDGVVTDARRTRYGGNRIRSTVEHCPRITRSGHAGDCHRVADFESMIFHRECDRARCRLRLRDVPGERPSRIDRNSAGTTASSTGTTTSTARVGDSRAVFRATGGCASGTRIAHRDLRVTRTCAACDVRPR